MTAHSPKRFQIAGALGPNTVYIERTCDAELVEHLRRGDHCHVLSARQVGKTSLVQRTLSALRTTHRVAYASAAAKNVTSDAWCRRLAGDVQRAVAPTFDLTALWERERQVDPIMRLRLALEALARADAGPAGADRPVVLVLDEVDVLRDFDFGYDVLVELRKLIDRDLQPFTLCLVGARIPADIVRERGTNPTPFPRCKIVEVPDFTREALTPFAQALGALVDPNAALDEIFFWTEGHPAFTQLLCARLVEDPAARVADLVDRNFLHPRIADQLMLDVATRFDDPTSVDVRAMLERYLDLLPDRSKNVTERRDAYESLRVAGLVRIRDRTVTPRNRIFTSEFNAAWASERLQRVGPFRVQLGLWLAQKNPSLLLTDAARLAEAERWESSQPALTADEREFLNASRASIEEARERARKRARIETLVVAAFAVLLAALAAQQLRLGRASAREAKSLRDAADASAQAADASAQAADLARRALEINRRYANQSDAAIVLEQELAQCQQRRDELLQITDAGATQARSQQQQIGQLAAGNRALRDASVNLSDALSAEANAHERTRAELAQMQVQRDHWRADAGALEAGLAAMTLERDHWRADADGLEAGLAACEARVTALTRERDHWRADAGALEAGLAACEARCPPTPTPTPTPAPAPAPEAPAPETHGSR